MVTGYCNLDKLKEIIEPFSIRRTKKDVEMDLPPIVSESIWIDLSAYEKELYNEIKKSAVSLHENGLSAIGAIQLARGLCNGEGWFEKKNKKKQKN